MLSVIKDFRLPAEEMDEPRMTNDEWYFDEKTTSIMSVQTTGKTLARQEVILYIQNINFYEYATQVQNKHGPSLS